MWAKSSPEDEAQNHCGKFWIKVVGFAECWIHTGFIHNNRSEVPCVVPQHHFDHSMSAWLRVFKSMEGTQVLSVAFLHNFEPESGKVCSERRWIVSPGGSEH